ncbi:molybdopterin molybdotransferase MoeA [Salinimonas chungwhensis]|uniref:molybdopterin molybdotransferase MoeA n=1 Tax=Salinimonas chungwhensis TaxID=265425 RepID=UPI00036A3ACC|nr:gephyrin-like molybdotransferase Glp [Salinimonas chungwhensis]
MTTSTWLSLDEALARIKAKFPTVKQTTLCHIDTCLGRITAQDIVAPVSVPPRAVSAMDGYAINTSVGKQNSCLPVVTTIFAGMDATDVTLEPGHAARIMTGAPVPMGADAVVMQENTTQRENTVCITQWPDRGENIRPQGNDIFQGDIIVEKGTRLQASHLMLLASVGMRECPVTAALKVAVLATGDELITPGTPLEAGQIYNANSVGVKALLHPYQADITDLGICVDDPAKLRDTLLTASKQFDILISSGGVSVGDADYVKDILDEIGEVDFWKVAIKPGKPFAFGQIGKCVFCGLPGNPVSAYVTTEKLVTPLIAMMQGEQRSLNDLTGLAVLGSSIRRRPGRQEFLRARLEINQDGGWHVTPLAKQSSGVMSTVTQANAYIVVPAETAFIESGTQVQVSPFRSVN